MLSNEEYPVVPRILDNAPEFEKRQLIWLRLRQTFFYANPFLKENDRLSVIIVQKHSQRQVIYDNTSEFI